MPLKSMFYRRRYAARRYPYKRRRVSFRGRGRYFTPLILRGRGGFWGDLWNRAKPIIGGGFRMLGNHLGNMALPGVGGPAGADIGGRISNFLGFGKYRSGRGSIQSIRQVPTMHGTTNAFCFKYTEYIGDVICSGTQGGWKSGVYVVNPGNSFCFPFLSSIAANFQSYRFKGLAFTYKPTSGETTTAANGNTALGKIIMSFAYNVNSPAYQNEIEQGNAMWSTVCKPSEYTTMGVECASKMLVGSSTKLVTSALQSITIDANGVGGALAGVPSGQDAHLYDMGYLQISSVGLPATAAVNLGEMHVSYDIELYQPTLQVLAGATNDTAHFTFTGVDNTHWIGIDGATRVTLFDHMGITLSALSVVFPAGVVGTFLLIFYWSGTAAAAGPPTVAAASNWVPKNMFSGGYSMGAPQSALAGQTQMMNMWAITLVNPSNVSTFTLNSLSGTPPGGTPTGSLLIQQINSDTV